MHNDIQMKLNFQKKQLQALQQQIREIDERIDERKNLVEGMSKQVLKFHTEKLHSLQLHLQQLEEDAQSLQNDNLARWLIIVLGCLLGPDVARIIQNRNGQLEKIQMRKDRVIKEIESTQQIIQFPKYIDEQKSLLSDIAADERLITQLRSQERELKAQIDAKEENIAKCHLSEKEARQIILQAQIDEALARKAASELLLEKVKNAQDAKPKTQTPNPIIIEGEYIILSDSNPEE